MSDDGWRPRCPPPRNLVLPSPLDPAGLLGPTRNQARRGGWRQTSYGFHVPAGTDSTVVEQRILEQSVRVGDDGAVTAWAALRLYGATYFDGRGPGTTPLPVPLVAARRLIDTDASVASRVSLAGHRIWRVQGIRCVGAERAVVDEVLRVEDRREAVVAIDMACAARITSLRRIRSYVERHSRSGNAAVLTALAHADEHSLSPPETRMRLVWVSDGGRPRPFCNATVYTIDGDFVGMPDLLDPVAGVTGEYNGAVHRSRAQHRKDTDRAERFLRAGLESFSVVAGDSVQTQLTRMDAAYARAQERSQRPRAWTLEPPPWGPAPRLTLDEELERRGWDAD